MSLYCVYSSFITNTAFLHSVSEYTVWSCYWSTLGVFVFQDFLRCRRCFPIRFPPLFLRAREHQVHPSPRFPAIIMFQYVLHWLCVYECSFFRPRSFFRSRKIPVYCFSRSWETPVFWFSRSRETPVSFFQSAFYSCIWTDTERWAAHAHDVCLPILLNLSVFLCCLMSHYLMVFVSNVKNLKIKYIEFWCANNLSISNRATEILLLYSDTSYACLQSWMPLRIKNSDVETILLYHPNNAKYCLFVW